MSGHVIVFVIKTTTTGNNNSHIRLSEFEFKGRDGETLTPTYCGVHNIPQSARYGADLIGASGMGSWINKDLTDNVYVDKGTNTVFYIRFAEGDTPVLYRFLTAPSPSNGESSFPKTWEVYYYQNGFTDTIAVKSMSFSTGLWYHSIPSGQSRWLGWYYIATLAPNPPTITINGNTFIEIMSSDADYINEEGASAVDYLGNDITSQIEVINNVNLRIPGSYKFIYSVTDSSGTTGTAHRTVVVLPSPTCFPAGTPIQMDQGETAIEQLVPGEHTLRGKNIIAITETRPQQKHIICFEKDSIGKNIPSQQTLCSKEHKVLYQGEMIKARDLVDMCKNVKKVAYNGETLYNVLLEKHGKMLVNNMICETLHPENIAAKIAKSKNSSMMRTMKR